MRNSKLVRMLLAFCLLLPLTAMAADEIPSAPREMRAVWVATVANIDWPSSPLLSVEDQKKEAIAILDKVKQLNMNAVILQIRPQADALYQSDLEPWSYYLTGEQGKAPDPFYDPLEFWIEESHARGIELHTWLNPYRAGHPAMRGEYSSKSMIKSKPKCVHKLQSAGYYWMDPALQEVQDHSYAVVMDVVKRYDVDAIHFDDYFYPYPEYNNNQDFPDEEAYKAYTEKGGKLTRGDWRREAVNTFIKRLYDGIKQEKPRVKFGISPFGIFRPGYPSTIRATFDQYSTLYADARLWLNSGWVDYYAPQLYWPISRIATSYPLLLGWWNSENKQGRNLWPGLYIRPETEAREMSREIVNQIMVTRAMVPQSTGTVIFSMKSMMSQDNAFAKALSEGPFASQALVPAFPWLDSKAPAPPTIRADKQNEELQVSWKPEGEEKPFLYVLYTNDNGKWSCKIFPEKTLQTSLKLKDAKISALAISAVDRCGNESEKKVLPIN